MEYIALKAQYRALKQEMDEAVLHCMENGTFILGDTVRRFEEELASHVGVKHVIGCGNGTDALQLIYMAYGIGAGDAVFCPDMTFIASIEPACMLGATPVFCDIDPVSYNLSVESLQKQIEAVNREGKLRPRAIIAVDFLGNPAEQGKLREIADRYGLLLVEDAAQAMGAEISGKKCGSFGHIAATSFFPSKPLGCYGDGGAVFTDDDEIGEKLRSLRVHGKGSSKYENIRIGVNSRLDTMQAAVLSVKLKHLSDEIKKRQLIAKRYDEALGECVGIPVIAEGNLCSYAQYVIRLKNKAMRDGLKQELESKGIPSIIYYPLPMHQMPVFQGIENYGEAFPEASSYAEQNLGLPFSAYLTGEEQKQVIEAVRGYLTAN